MFVTHRFIVVVAVVVVVIVIVAFEQVVTPESANIGVGEFIETDYDHLTVCKPAHRHDMRYQRVVEFVRQHLPKPADGKQALILPSAEPATVDDALEQDNILREQRQHQEQFATTNSAAAVQETAVEEVWQHETFAEQNLIKTGE